MKSYLYVLDFVYFCHIVHLYFLLSVCRVFVRRSYQQLHTSSVRPDCPETGKKGADSTALHKYTNTQIHKHANTRMAKKTTQNFQAYIIYTKNEVATVLKPQRNQFNSIIFSFHSAIKLQNIKDSQVSIPRGNVKHIKLQAES